MTFKQNTKMSASGSHYCAGGKVKKMASGGGTGFVNVPQTNAPAGSGTRLTQKDAANIASKISSPAKSDTAFYGGEEALKKPAPKLTPSDKTFYGADTEKPAAKTLSQSDRAFFGLERKKGGKVTRGNKRK